MSKRSGRNLMSAKDRRRRRAEVTERDGPNCHWCGAPNAGTLDHHPVPFSEGGSNGIHNLVLACFDCNSERGRIHNGDNPRRK